MGLFLGLVKQVRDLIYGHVLVILFGLLAASIGGLEAQAVGVGEPWITLLSIGSGGIVICLAQVVYVNWLADRVVTRREHKQRQTFALASHLEREADTLYRWEGKTRTGRDLPAVSSRDGLHPPLPYRRLSDATDEQTETMFDQVHSGQMRELYHDLVKRKLAKASDHEKFYNLGTTAAKLALADHLMTTAERVRGSVR